MEPDKTPDQGPHGPSHIDRVKSDPKKLKDLINRFMHHENQHPEEKHEGEKPKAEERPAPPAAPLPPAPPKPAEEKTEHPHKLQDLLHRFSHHEEKPKEEHRPAPSAGPSKHPEVKEVQTAKKEPAGKPVPPPAPPAPQKPKAAPAKKVSPPAPLRPAGTGAPGLKNVKGSWIFRKKKTLIFIVAGVLVLYFGGKFVVGVFQKFTKPSISQTLSDEEKKEKDKPVAVKGFKVGRFNYEDSLNVLGTIKGAQEVKLSFEIPGVISSVNYKEGERYEEGALLISLKQDDILLRLKRAQAAFNKAESQAKVTENEVAENEKLLKMGAIPASTLEKKKLEMDAAKFEAETQRLEMKANESMLEKSNLYAPSLGMLGDLNVQEGENVSQNTLIGTHINTEFVFAEFGVVERDIQKISMGQKAKVFVDAYPDKTFEGVIENVAQMIVGTSRTATVRVRIENPEGLLLPGMFARIRILLYSKKDAIVVPTDAVQGGEGEKWVYVIKFGEASEKDKAAGGILPQQGGISGLAALVAGSGSGKKGNASEESKKEEGVAEKRPITVGYTRPDYTQLDAGVTEGELVVLTGFERLEDGKKIRLVETQEAEL